MVRRARRYTFVDRLADALTLAILHGMTTGMRPAIASPVAPRRPSFPAQFKSREEWLAWCEEDRRSEMAEMQECVWTQEFGGVE